MILYIFLVCMCYASEYKTYEDDYIQFSVPESELIDFKTDKRNPSHIRILVNYVTNEDLVTRASYSFSELLYKQIVNDKMKINKSHIIELIDSNDVFKTRTFSIGANWYKYNGEVIERNYLINSYEKFFYNGQPIGEQFISLDRLLCGYDAFDKYFSCDYHINFVMNDKIVYIRFELTWGNFGALYQEFPDWFELRNDGKYYWINKEKQNEFFKVFNKNEYMKLPKTLMLLRETRDYVMKTLVIKDN